MKEWMDCQCTPSMRSAGKSARATIAEVVADIGCFEMRINYNVTGTERQLEGNQHTSNVYDVLWSVVNLVHQFHLGMYSNQLVARTKIVGASNLLHFTRLQLFYMRALYASWDSKIGYLMIPQFKDLQPFMKITRLITTPSEKGVTENS